MNTIYLALKIIWKQKFLNLFLILTIILSIGYLSPVLNRVIHYTASIQTLNRIDMENAYYLYGNPFYGRTNSILRDSINKKITSFNYIEGRAEFFYLQDNELPYPIFAYNDLLIHKFKPKLRSGIWLDKAAETTYIPVVVANHSKLSYNEIFPLTFSSGDRTIRLLCKVVGILEPSTKIVTFSGAADEEYFTTDTLLSSTDSEIIIPLTKEIENFFADKAYLISSKGSLLYTSSDVDYTEVLNDFGYAGIVTELGKGTSRFYVQSKIVAAAMGAYFLVYFFVALLSLLCSSFLLNIRMQKIYTIYYLYGMSQSKRFKIEVIRILMMISTCSIISFLYVSKNGILDSFYEDFHPLFIFAGILCYVSLIFVPISCGFLIKSRNELPSESIRRLHI